MAIWGVGAKFGSWDSKLDDFIREHFWCTGYTESEKPKIYDTIKSIDIGDIIYVKSLPINSNNMRVWAIGIVTDEFKNSNSHTGFENCHNEIGVKWIIPDLNEVSTGKEPLTQIEINDQYINERKNTIFKEYNREIIEKIVKIISIKIFKE